MDINELTKLFTVDLTDVKTVTMPADLNTVLIQPRLTAIDATFISTGGSAGSFPLTAGGAYTFSDKNWRNQLLTFGGTVGDIDIFVTTGNMN